MGGDGRALPAAALALATCLAGVARADPPAARADLTYGDEQGLASEQRFFRHRYDLALRNQVSPPIAYRLQLIYQEERGDGRIGEADQRIWSRRFEPRGDLSWATEAHSLNLRYELSYAGTFGGVQFAAADRRTQRGAVSATWKLAPALDVRAAGERLAVVSPGRVVTDDRAAAGWTYAAGDLHVDHEGHVQRTDGGDSSRAAYGTRMAIDVQHAFASGAVLGARYSGDWSRFDDRFTASGVLTAIEVAPVGGLYVLTDLYLDTSAAPMQPLAGLVDRDFGASAGIAVGPDGASFQNVGLDMGRVVELAVVRLSVRSASGDLVAAGGPVIWDAYWSNDGVRWTPVTGSLSRFDEALSAYEVAFAPLSARFFKAVNFGTNGVETYVTEIQGFVRERVSTSGIRTSQAVLQSASASASVRPWEKLAVSYSGNLNANASIPDAGSARWVLDSSHSLGANVGPFGPFSLLVGHTRWDARSPGLPLERSLSSSAAVAWRPIPEVDAAIEARNAELRTQGVTAVTDGVGLRGRLRFLETIQLAANGDYSRQVLPDGGVTFFVSAGGAAALRPRGNLELRTSATLQRTISERGDTSAAEEIPLLHVVQFERYQLDATYAPSRQLHLGARVGYARSEAAEGVVQTYRIAWTPLRASAVQVVFDYSEELDPLADRSFRRLRISPRWIVNPHAILQLNYNRTRGTGSQPVRDELLYVTLSVRT